eukprot:2475081-Karenia_brevis.AAC.1
MLSYSANPRTLADDLLLTTSGSRALTIFRHCFTCTISHLQDMGGKLSPHKSKLFSTIASHRSWLSTFAWDHVNQTIPVVHNMRDLGASIIFTSNISTTLSQIRFARACRTLYRIGCLPHDRAVKTTFITTAAHPQALYGCEVSHVDESELRRYTSAVAATIGTSNRHHA